MTGHNYQTAFSAALTGWVAQCCSRIAFVPNEPLAMSYFQDLKKETAGSRLTGETGQKPPADTGSFWFPAAMIHPEICFEIHFYPVVIRARPWGSSLP